MSNDVSIDERVFRAHIDMALFQSGVDRKRWRLVSIIWPHAIIAVSAVPRDKSAAEYALRFELTNYPKSAPTAQPWDIDDNSLLEPSKRPHGKSRVPMAFRTDWNNGQALYLPCDRAAIHGHEQWHQQHPSMIWSPDHDITQYLRIVYDLLNSNDYTGQRCS
jgi:hypothetical protein